MLLTVRRSFLIVQGRIRSPTVPGLELRRGQNVRLESVALSASAADRNAHQLNRLFAFRHVETFLVSASWLERRASTRNILTGW